MKGRIHSTESFGTVDGPGIRFVVFTQGCPMRCQYCHNPDTWDPVGGSREISVEELLEEYDHNKSFYKDGGITVTGGEPLLQIDFVTELFEAAKQKGIHTCLDTSGITFQPGNPSVMKKMDRLMECTDLVMLDIKHIDPEEHLKLTSRKNDNILSFARYVDEKAVPLWIRHVVVPGITDQVSHLKRLGEYIAELRHVKALDVLPYHTMGISKYKELGMEYPLEGVPALDKKDAVKAKEIILEAFRAKRRTVS
ncbi:pyruvate formate-lyase-activating protein [Cuneatibacter caecimuris]|uniref:Pyruvate formate-lyase-activating enzyme n=1 Tax=Cuneatibacter caecimuris TaxID=1796618 RepID=A0A4Q7P3H9_9FIRM|nr:pyruvate formate-lyase-activating protein [Cuneatibacter caecimuris]RZS94374.1 pyruvate formate lyase activating enzyme [Cuneatibacter caecimuris]